MRAAGHKTTPLWRQGGRDVLGGVALALSMFSRIPVRSPDWDTPAMRFALAAWPLVGLIEGVACMVWVLLAAWLDLPPLLVAVVFALLPMAVNGGIHIDGLCDTSDALASHSTPARCLEIMADPRVGSFAVLTLCSHLLLTVSLLYAAPLCQDLRLAVCLGLMYPLLRALAGITAINWPCARNAGLAHTFSSRAWPGTTAVLVVWCALCTLAQLVVYPLLGLMGLVMAGLVLLWYARLVRKRFGGITGDTSGWFIQTAQLLMTAVICLGGVWL